MPLMETMKFLKDLESLAVGVLPAAVRLNKNNPLRRFPAIDRAAARIDGLVSNSFKRVYLPEIRYQSARFMERRGYLKASDELDFRAFEHFSERAEFHISRSDTNTTLVRAGFGTKINRSRGLFVTDLSMAHPLSDRFLTSGIPMNSKDDLSKVSKLMIRDLDNSDRILVNSNFVKDTLLENGYNDSKIFISYLQPKKFFADFAEANSLILDSKKGREKTRVLFCGNLSLRKGVENLYSLALICKSKYPAIKFRLVGQWSHDAYEVREKFIALSNVEHRGWVSQEDLAEEYLAADYYFFPTKSDGGARVITEAMLFGLVVVTTECAGSPIKQNFDGLIIKEKENATFIETCLGVLENPILSERLSQNARTSINTMVADSTYFQGVLKAFE